MDQRPSATSEERRSEQELIPPGQEQTQPKSSDAYISVWTSRKVDKRPGRRVHSILLSALFGVASAAAVLLFVALALMSIPLVGILSVVAMFAIFGVRSFAAFARLWSAANRTEPNSAHFIVTASDPDRARLLGVDAYRLSCRRPSRCSKGGWPHPSGPLNVARR
jgi:Flp pilus assembly protein TadB